MFTLATVSVLSSVLLWTVYHNFLEFNSTQIPQHSSQDTSHPTRDPKIHISNKIDRPAKSSKLVQEISDLNALNKKYFEGHVTDSFSKESPKVQNNFEGGDEGPTASKGKLSDTSESKTSLEGDTSRHDNVDDLSESSADSGDIARKDDDDVNTYDSEDDNVYDDIDIHNDNEISSYAIVGNTDKIDQITEDDDKTDIKDKFTDDTSYSEDDRIKGTTEKSINQELHEKADHSLLHENKEIPNDKIRTEIHTFTDNLLNISDNVIKLLIGNKEITTLPKKSSKMEENFHLKGKLVDGNSASILYSLTSYIFHLEINKSLDISSQTQINTKNLKNLEPSDDITNVPAETRSHSTDTNRQQENDLKLNPNPAQLPNPRPKPNIVTKKIIRVKTQAQDDFMTYFKSQTWEVFVTLAAVIVVVLLLMMFIMVWGTQHIRKIENRKRLLRIQAMENQREI